MSAAEGFWLGLQFGFLWGALSTVYALGKFGFLP